MAKKLVEQLFDDVDGSEIMEGGGEQVHFSLRNVHYQIDLSNANIAKLEKALKPYIGAAVTVKGGRVRRPKQVNGAAKASPEQLVTIRHWARSNGYDVAGRGRIPIEVRNAFEAAHS